MISKRKRFGVLLTPLFVLAACQGDQKSTHPPASPQAYSVLTLTPQSATILNDFPATIEGIEIVQLRPMVDGYLEKIYVPEGGNVKKGELLFKIQNPIYEQNVITAQAAIKIAQADVDAAKMDVEKVRPLVEKDIVSKYELESAQYTLESKIAALDQANAALRRRPNECRLYHTPQPHHRHHGFHSLQDRRPHQRQHFQSPDQPRKS